MSVAVKICGLNDETSLATALDGGADFIGLVFYPPSPRAVTPQQAAGLAAAVGGRAKIVGLFVDPSDEDLDRVLAAVPLDWIQLHGSETPERVAAIRSRCGKPVLKAIKVAARADIAQAEDYVGAVDMLLFDAKAPKDMADALPGGNGLTFDWNLLAGKRWPKPWMLSGGLDAGNVAEAIATAAPDAVDVSSGVEERPGRKDPARIKAFLDAVKGL